MLDHLVGLLLRALIAQVTGANPLQVHSAYLDRAKAETVIITEDREPSLVVLSWKVFSQLRRGNRQAMKIEDLSEEDIAAITAPRMPPV